MTVKYLEIVTHDADSMCSLYERVHGLTIVIHDGVQHGLWQP